MTDRWEFHRTSDELATGPATRVIVKVRSPHHVPEGFALRSRVDAYLFTADADERAISAAGADPEVEAVSRGTSLRLN